MINLISAGDLDFYRIKRYICDSKDDFIELPVVAEGSTVTIISTGETYKIDAEGNWNLDSTLGGGGYTPVKGTDYWTEEDKSEIIEDLMGMKPIKPVYDAELGNLYCNGIGIIISDSGTDNIITYDLDTDTTEIMNVPYNTRIFGGGNGVKQPCSYSGTSIVMNSGKVRCVSGGGLGGCNVGSASIVINGGTVTEGISGGGLNNKKTDDSTGNIVGYSSVVVNGGESLILFGGGGSGLARVGSADVEVNGGKIQWMVPSGSNGNTGAVKLVINDGEFECVQGVNRGSIGSAVITVNGGVINRLYGGGETEDSSVNGICGKSVLNILGGQVNKLAKGTSGGVESADFISGTYVSGVIGNEEIAPELNLKLVPTLEETIKRLIAVEQTVTVTDIEI